MTHSDTQNVAFYDEKRQRYVGYIRIDNGKPPAHPSNETCPSQTPIRRIGRCDIGESLAPPWPCTVEDAEDVLTFDAQDPACLDLYTNAATQYYGVYLFFPSIFMHMTLGTGTENDGIVEGRLAVSRDGVKAAYVKAPMNGGRQPFLPLGVTRCDHFQETVLPRGLEYCAYDSSNRRSDFDSAEIYTAPGVAESPNGEWLYLYYGGTAYTHSEAGTPAFGMHNSGVGAAMLRMDGFVSLNAPQVYNVASLDALPTFTTKTLTIPSAAACPKPHNTSAPATCPGGNSGGGGGGGGGHNGSCTTCGYELPGRSCTAAIPQVPCKTTSDCGTNAGGRPVAALTCGGIAVSCGSTGFCTSKLSDRGYDLCYTPEMKPPAPITEGGLELVLNVETGVAGLVYIELELDPRSARHSGRAGEAGGPHGLSLGVRGNYVEKVVRWEGFGTSLTAVGGSDAVLRVVMTDAKLYSATFRCAAD